MPEEGFSAQVQLKSRVKQQGIVVTGNPMFYNTASYITMRGTFCNVRWLVSVRLGVFVRWLVSVRLGVL